MMDITRVIRYLYRPTDR